MLGINTNGYPCTYAARLFCYLWGKRFHKTRRWHKRSSGRKRYPSSIQTYVATSCCASSKGRLFPEKTTFAARASSTSMFERRKLFLNPDARQQHMSREKNSQVMYSSTTVQFRRFGYSNEGAIISDTIIPSQTQITSCSSSRRPSKKEQRLLRE